MSCLSKHASIVKIAVQKAAQTDLTQLASNAVLFYVANFSLPGLKILPREQLARQVCDRTLRPSISLCRAKGSGRMRPRRESNTDQKFRKLPFYPLNYGDKGGRLLRVYPGFRKPDG